MARHINKIILVFCFFMFLSVMMFSSGFTEITDNSSIFGGNVTAEKFFEYDGTYVIPIYRVDWSDGVGDLVGIGLNASVNLSKLYYALISSWGNITGKPTDVSYFYNDIGYLTSANISQTQVQGDGIYTYNTTFGSVTTIHFNESKLNQTITTMTGIFEENITISVSGGVGSGITSVCCYGTNEIMNVAVFPTSIGNKYKFSANTSVTGEVVDSDLAKHTGNWIVAHRGSVITNEKINYYITNADIDEIFRVRVRWQK